MKRLHLISCAVALLALSSCSQMQQVQTQPDVPPASPDENENITEQAEATEATAQNGENAISPTEEQEAGKGHVCSGLLSCKLGLCPNGRKAKAAALAAAPAEPESSGEEPIAANEDVSEEAPEDGAPISPTAEQQAAARDLLTSTPAPAPRRSRRAASAPAEVEPAYTAPVAAATTSGIPGRGGLRMGRFAPPEEGSSTAEGNTPLPNAAERHGLRSPSLPGSLPMDIDGRTISH